MKRGLKCAAAMRAITRAGSVKEDSPMKRGLKCESADGSLANELALKRTPR